MSASPRVGSPAWVQWHMATGGTLTGAHAPAGWTYTLTERANDRVRTHAVPTAVVLALVAERTIRGTVAGTDHITYTLERA